MVRAAARRRRWSLIAGLVTLVLVDLLQLYVPRLIKFAVDDLTLGKATEASLLWQAGAVAGLALAMALLRVIWRPLLFGFARLVETELRQELFDHLQSMHVGYLGQHSPGELMAKATNDLNNLRMAAGMGLVAATDGLVMTICALGFMLFLSPWLTLLAVLPLPLTIWVTRVQSRKMYRGYMRVQESFERMTEQVREALSGIQLVKAFGLARRENARLAESGREYVGLNLSLARVLALFFPLMVFFTNISLAMVLGAGGPLAVLGQISPGDFVAFSAYLQLLTWPMMALGWVVSLLKRAQASAQRVDEVLNATPQVQDPPHPLSLPARPQKGLEVRDLSFTHEGAERPTLSQVSLRARPGETVALVGPIASGKSTLLSLLGRLYDPPRGAVLVEGRDVLDLAQGDLRGFVGQVPQDALIFSATLKTNLRMARPGASDEQLWQALARAELAREVKDLPKGLETMLGERGHNLSGGQRQRLALARALLLDPPMLVLDDPLSAVDSQTEQRILAGLGRDRSERVTLVVSHRLGSVAFANRIYVLQGGRLVEEGSHQELMDAHGLYHALFAEQALLGGEE